MILGSGCKSDVEQCQLLFLTLYQIFNIRFLPVPCSATYWPQVILSISIYMHGSLEWLIR